MFNNLKNGLDFLYFEVNEFNGKSIFRAKNIEDNDNFPNAPKPFEGDASSNDFFSPDFYFEINFDLEEDQQLRNDKLNIINTKEECEYDDDDLRTLNLNIRDFNRNCGYTLGFRRYKYTIDSSNTYIDNITYDSIIEYKCYLESESFYGDTINKYILVDIDDFNKNSKNNFIASTNKGFINNNIVAKLPIFNEKYNVIYNNTSNSSFNEKIFFAPTNIYKMRIKLLDKYGDLIDLKNTNYSLSIDFEQIYS